MEDDTYEIIYDNGVPVIAFQICDDAEPAQKEENEDPPSADAVEDNETLQYFREDETIKKTKSASNVKKKAKAQNREVEEVPIGRRKDKLDFVIVQGANKNNSKKLFDSLGYAYTLRNVSVREGVSIWRCRYKMKKHDRKECGAKLRITMDDQITMLQRHLHPPDKTVDFELLKRTRKEAPKTFPAHGPQQQTKSISQNCHGSDKLKGRNLKQNVSKTDLKECDKVLDYFSEGRELENAEDVQLVHEREVTDGFWTEGQMEHESNAVSEDNQKVQFRVVANGNLTGTQILYDSLGYSYSIKLKKDGTTTWSCQSSLASDGTPCQVSVLQDGAQFTCFGEHSHTPKRHTLLKISKMQVFSPDKCTNEEQAVKRKSPTKFVSPKKVKREAKKSWSYESEDEDHLGLAVKKIKRENNNEESFQFNTGDISFTVLLESDEVNDEKNKSQPRKPPQSPSLSPQQTINKLKKMAMLAQYSKQNKSSNVQYQVVENSPINGTATLFDSMGHLYTAADVGELRTMWLCSSSCDEYCPAKVVQSMKNFTRNLDHSHPPNLVEFVHNLVQLEAVEILKDPTNTKKSPAQIVNGILERYSEFSLNLSFEHLVETITQYKRKVGEKPRGSTIKRTINKKKIPKRFLLDQIMTETKFHLTFASEIQLAYLAAATEWYVDEADLDMSPFTNLFSIHVYTQHEQQPRQTPVFFALISERRESDYSQLFTSIKSALKTPLNVSSIVIDLNIPLRKSLLKSFTDIEIKCCDLHWSEDIANKLKDMDLSNFYGDYQAMNYLYQIPLLNLLPRQVFETALCKIEGIIEDDSVQDLICYIRETFGERSLWAPKYWSSFKMPVRISNHDLWRRDLISDNSSDVDIYAFIRSLYLISKSIGDNLRLMPKKKIKKYYLSRPETILCKVYHQWKKYCKGEYNCHSLLEKLASIIHSF